MAKDNLHFYYPIIFMHLLVLILFAHFKKQFYFLWCYTINHLNISIMKKLIYTLTAVIMLGLSVNTVAAAEKAPVKELTEQQQVQLQQLQRRVEEIKSMDKSDLSRQERKELKKELKEMKDQARAVTGGGVYLSVGAIIIIILLLILIL